MIQQFIPIIIVFILLSYPKTVIQFSHSILGRFIVVSIIIFYSSLDKYLGLLVCGLVIFYYQMDYVEGMISDINENFDNLITTSTDFPSIINGANDTITTLLNNSYKQYTYYNDLYNEVPYNEVTKNNSEKDFKKDFKPTKNANSSWSTTDKEINPSPKGADLNLQRFKKENCDDDGNLIFKNSIINLEMIEYLFPEIKFSKNKCNPCDNNCNFNIIEKKLVTEEKMKPISTMQ